jgi:hypothetical protein
MIDRFVNMAMPFDALKIIRKLTFLEIVPHKEVGIHRIDFGQPLEVCVGLASRLSPFFRINEINIVPVVDVLDRGENAGFLDSRYFKKRFDHCIAEI